MTVRDAIHKELKRRRWSRYRLIQELDGRVPPSTVYDYLSGKCDLGSERVSVILGALGLTVTGKATKGRKDR